MEKTNLQKDTEKKVKIFEFRFNTASGERVYNRVQFSDDLPINKYCNDIISKMNSGYAIRFVDAITGYGVIVNFSNVDVFSINERLIPVNNLNEGLLRMLENEGHFINDNNTFEKRI